MDSITVSRTYDASPDAVREKITDLEPFMMAAGFDEVSIDGESIEVTNSVGIATIELTLELTDHKEADLAYEQREGIFEAMQTTYTVTETETGSEVTAATEFALDVAVVGELLDATVIKRQRRRELSAQFDWLEDQLTDSQVES
ncbi:SRPBCC family protein [Halovenus sp. HT40]|uniref:SRPBCC family protein n=1 Tax=Halovenus sp. HT40 TaxID=3126691 RepID=UPI00300EAF5E